MGDKKEPLPWEEQERRLLKFIRSLHAQKFYGKLEVAFHHGDIGVVFTGQTIKLEAISEDQDQGAGRLEQGKQQGQGSVPAP